MSLSRRLLFFCTSIFLFSCSSDDDIPPLYGEPTPILTDQSPIEVVCAIQSEFKQLPKPLLQRQSFQSPWTSRPIGAANVDHQGFIRIHLHDEALVFLQQHSRLEIVASLTPLLNDPELSGEIAVLLAGIPAGNKSSQGSLTRDLANTIDRRSYASPQQPGQWHNVDEFKYHYFRRYYGLFNATSRIHKREIDTYQGSLEQALVNILEDYSKAPPLPLEGDRIFGPQSNDDENIHRWITDHSIPALKPKAQNFINKYRVDVDNNTNSLMGTIALLPTMPQPGTFMEATEYYMIWMLGVEDKYWPATIAKPHGEAIPAKLRNDLRREIVATLGNVCGA